ncbi:DNA-binding response regulator [Streptomyces sp. WAC02707]|uniref:response regulator transcription factor n=1 Tax=Streptomyces sp. WAC02707 TaxID=2487417 RepID=UPI000F79CDCC|nr:response regulator transcription factor [Streptomyces sp. WAC02707]RSS83136.1 DNA-binding response regulator [Streptomyces sp. WAC02707]
MIKVLVADDNDIMRRGLRLTLDAEDDITVVAEARTGREAVEAARRYQPDVVLMDVRMPEGGGIDATRRVLALHAPPAVLVLTTFDRDEYIEQVIRAGAAGFLLKDTPPEDLIKAVRMVREGHTMIDPAVVRRALDLLAAPAVRLTDEEERALGTLTTREKEVLGLVSAGLSNASIATELSTSESTVKGHVSRIMEKLHAENRVQAARIAYRAGLDTEG